MKQLITLIIILIVNIIFPILIGIGLINLNLVIVVISTICECICLLISFALILKQFSKNPKNDLTQFSFKWSNKKYGNALQINVTREKNIWKTNGLEDEIFFEFSDYLFQKSYIASYFIRQIHYRIINEKHLVLKELFKQQKTPNINTLILIFNYANKEERMKIVCDGKSKLSFLIKMILKGKYTRHFYHKYAYNNCLNSFVYMTERKFLNSDISASK